MVICGLASDARRVAVAGAGAAETMSWGGEGMAAARRALLIGIRHYQNANELVSAQHDVAVLGKVLADPEIGDFSVDTTAPNLGNHDFKEHVELFFEKAKRTDELLIYIACHGVLERRKILYFANYSTRMEAISRRQFRRPSCAKRWQNPIANESRLSSTAASVAGSGNSSMPRTCCAGDWANIGPGRRSLMVMTSADQFELASGGTGLSPFAQVLAEGLRTGEADLDGDGYVSGRDLHSYVEQKFLERNQSQQPQLVFDPFLERLRIAKNPSRPLKFDESRYEEEVWSRVSAAAARPGTWSSGISCTTRPTRSGQSRICDVLSSSGRKSKAA